MVSHTAVGFKGTVRQDGEARRMARLGPRFVVDSADDWAVTATSADRTVSIAPGSGQACGVTDTTTAAESLQLPVNSSGQTRYDLIVNRFLWTDPVTDPVFTYVLGIPGAGVPNVAGLTQIPGTQYDGVLAVARVASGQGALTGNDLHREAMWLGPAGQLMVSNMAARPTAVRPAGLRITAADRPTAVYVYDGTRWVQEGVVADVSATPAGSYVSRQEGNPTVNIADGLGGFAFDLPWAFSAIPLRIALTPGDYNSPIIAPVGVNQSPSRLNGRAYQAGGQPVPAGQQIRVVYDAIGYNT